jgi:hypothetical protein
MDCNFSYNLRFLSTAASIFSLSDTRFGGGERESWESFERAKFCAPPEHKVTIDSDSGCASRAPCSRPR